MSDAAHIQALIAQCCGLQPEDCTPDASLYELGVDSLGLASIVSHCELHLSMDFDDDTVLEIMSARTVGQITEAILAPASRNHA